MPGMYRRRGRRGLAIRPVQSFKNVVDIAPTSNIANTKVDYEITEGEDVAAGQATSASITVPTGSTIKSILVNFATQNLVNVAAFMWVTIQRVHTQQTTLPPRLVGSSSRRNQVFFQRLISLGTNQNQLLYFRFRIPRGMQRVREGDKWILSFESDQIHQSAAQFIYKFYR